MTREMKIFAGKSIGFLLLFYAVNFLFSKVLDKTLPTLTGQKMYWNLSRKNQDLDYVILGSSRSLNNVDIAAVDSLTRMQGLNISHPGSGFIDNYLTLQQFYANGNAAQTICLQVDMFSLYSDSSFSYPFHDFLLMPYLDQKPEIAELVYTYSRFSEHELLWKFAPFTRYMEFNSQYDITFFLNGKPSKGKQWDEWKGSELRFRKTFKKNMPLKDKKFEVTEKDALFLEKIVTLCRSNGSKVIFFTAPVYTELLGYYDLTVYDRYMDDFVRKEQIPYFNFRNDSMNLDQRNFMDYTHLSQQGVALFSAKLAAGINIELSGN